MIQNCQIELKARLCLTLSDSPTLYKSTARVRFGNSQKQFIKRKTLQKQCFSTYRLIFKCLRDKLQLLKSLNSAFDVLDFFYIPFVIWIMKQSLPQSLRKRYHLQFAELKHQTSRAFTLRLSQLSY